MKVLIERDTARWFNKIAERFNHEMAKAQKANDTELWDRLNYILWGTAKEKQAEINRIKKG